ncbi:hypothetical protein LguiA_034853 [Lonicera macranthoides]
MKSATLQLHSLNTQTMFLFLAMPLLAFSSALGVNETDLLALRAIKSKIIYDPKGVLGLWNDSFHHCKWEGVTCGHRHKRVTGLDLSSRGLVGSLSPYIGNLSFLRVIQLNNNTLEGEIPPEVGRLFRLQQLNLNKNSINGQIPANLSHCSQLTHLLLGNNTLVGEIPNQLGSLLKLKSLVIQKNRLTGQIPSFIGNFTYLETISGAYNHLSGAIPDSFGRLNNLSILLFGVNNLSGMIPQSIYNLSLLTEFSFPLNQLYGSLPLSLGLMLPRLRLLQLHHNQFNGLLPSSISNCSKLEILGMERNNFSGKIAISFNQLPNLWLVTLFLNNFGSGEHDEMKFVDSLVNCTNLHVLDLNSNQLDGILPMSIANLSAQLFYMSLGGNYIYGTLPSAIGNLVSLSSLSFEFNQLTGTIPSSIGNLQQLQRLALEVNEFSGKIPVSMGNLSLLNELYLSYNRLEGAIPSTCVTMVLAFFLFLRLRKRATTQPSGLLLKESLVKVSYEQLLKATNGFSSENLIGVGSFGSVYKGIFDEDNGVIVAIKVLKLDHRGASKSFMAECEALRNIRHRNLVKIITSCSSVDFQGNDFKALVYDFMPNGSLDKWLRSNLDSKNRLNFLQCINIAIDVANAIDYLHNHCQTPIIHCDLKPGNILLDSDMVAHVGDFGLARFLLELNDGNQNSSIGIRGTVGYAAPEYGLGSEVSKNGDIYSYGILLLEMMTGKRPTDPIFEGSHNLHNFAITASPDHLVAIEAESMLRNSDKDAKQINNNNQLIDCFISVIKIGVACSMESPHDRMDIVNVIRELHSVQTILSAIQTSSEGPKASNR